MHDPIPSAGGADPLTDREVAALAEAAGRYLREREDEMARLVGDASAAAQERRLHFRDVYDALEKLGFRLRRPPGL